MERLLLAAAIAAVIVASLVAAWRRMNGGLARRIARHCDGCGGPHITCGKPGCWCDDKCE